MLENTPVRPETLLPPPTPAAIGCVSTTSSARSRQTTSCLFPNRLSNYHEGERNATLPTCVLVHQTGRTVAAGNQAPNSGAEARCQVEVRQMVHFIGSRDTFATIYLSLARLFTALIDD